MMAMLNIEPHLLISHLHDLTSADAKVTADSRQIEPGDIFFAYSVGHGSALRDGRDYIAAALANGAAAVVFDPADGVANEYLDRPECFAVENLSSVAGDLCSEWYGYPSKKLNIIGVTGTNGKTSITQWLAQALDASNHRTAVMGTLGTGFPGALIQTGYTTPDAPRLQTQLNELLEAGAQQVAIEISSHALDQDRVAGLDVRTAVFTNLTQDHLDYHGTMGEYAAAKAKLFQFPQLENAIINFDDTFGRELAMKLLAIDSPQVWGFALSNNAFAGFEKFGNRLKRAYAKNTLFTTSGYESQFNCDDLGSSTVKLSVLGEFNLSNCLAVWATLLAQGMSPDEASKRMTKLTAVSGRMELIRLNKAQKAEGPLIVVDYAHTPDALEKVLSTLKTQKKEGAKLICVFGCGGDRDAGKRELMGKIASDLADAVVVTSDNPRHENKYKIINEILQGMQGNYLIEQDRAKAIKASIFAAKSGDIVLIAGKGHEQYQEIKDKKHHFSDLEQAQKVLKKYAETLT
jgi:UDP-N-acetylmuramoyl-L-alanyl-D-glutamate--2,6-diaminopimelate ligase